MAEPTDDKLRMHIEAIENLEAEKKGISDDIKDRIALMKADGYDTKIAKQIVKLRKMRPDDIAYQEEMLEVYKAAMGIE